MMVSTQIIENTENEIIDLNGIEDVKVTRVDEDESKTCCLCCKFWKIIYKVIHINKKNEEVENRIIVDWPSNRNDDKSNIIKKDEKRRLGFI